VAVEVILWTPSEITPEVKLQLPAPSATTVPSVASTELIIEIILFASAVPVNVGVVSIVTLSLLDIPLSLAELRSTTLGADGAEVSTVIDSEAEALLTFPAGSEAVADTIVVPIGKTSPVALQFPAPSAVVEEISPATGVVINEMVQFASEVPVNVGVVSEVILSVDEDPVSLAAVRSGVLEAAGGV